MQEHGLETINLMELHLIRECKDLNNQASQAQQKHEFNLARDKYNKHILISIDIDKIFTVSYQYNFKIEENQQDI